MPSNPDRARCLIVTRPEPELQRTADRLAARGYRVLKAPCTRIRPLATAFPEPGATAEIVIPSPRCLRFLAPRLRRRDSRLWCVGPESTRLAYSYEFRNLETAPRPGLEALASHMARTLPAQTQILAPGAAHRAYDMSRVADRAYGTDADENPLIQTGFTVHRINLYEAVPVSGLSAEIASALINAETPEILFYSARTARIFESLSRAAGVVEELARARALCLSERVLNSLQENWGTAVCAADPSEEGLWKEL